MKPAGEPRGLGDRIMGRSVNPVGSKTARFVLVGEAPGRNEDIRGEPFVGKSGSLIRDYMRLAETDRSEWWIDNAYDKWPGKAGLDKVPKEEKERAADELHARIAALESPQLIVTAGAHALRVLTRGRCDKVLKWRGSMIEYEDLRGRRIKLIPTIHPAAVMRDPTLQRCCIRDWRLIGQEKRFPELRLPIRRCNVDPTMADIDAFIAEVERDPTRPLSVDIETPKKPPVKQRRILCIGFALEADFGFVIPTMHEHWGRGERIGKQAARAANRRGKQVLEEEVWPRVRRLLLTPNPKVAHNGIYDYYWLEQWLGLKGARDSWQWDTMGLHHTLRCNDRHSLAYCASMDTRQPFWKDDAKDWMTATKAVREMESLFRYNALDAQLTIELFKLYHKRAAERGLLERYDADFRQVYPVLLDMMAAGYRQDIGRREALLVRLLERGQQLAEVLREMNGGEPVTGAKGSVAPQRAATFLYGRLGVEAVRDRRTGKVTTNEVALRRITQAYEGAPREAAFAILESRRVRKTAGTLPLEKLDPDGYFRSSYSPTAETGRMRSSASPFGTGGNSANKDRRLRYLDLPDVGDVLMEVDLSQIQDRLVKVYTRAPRLIDIARMPPGEGPDTHSELAALIFNAEWYSADPKESHGKKERKRMRQIAKSGRYLDTFDGKASALCEWLAKAQLFITETEANHILLTARSTMPEYTDWHRSVRETLMSAGRLIGPRGHVWDVRDMQLCGDLYRAGYAWLAQRGEVDIMTERGLVAMHRWLRENPGHGRILGHNHDALMFSCPPERVHAVAAAMFASMERPFDCYGIEMTPWCEVKIGRAWGDEPARPEIRDDGDIARVNTYDWKRLPSREEMTERALALVAGQVPHDPDRLADVFEPDLADDEDEGEQQP